MFISGRTRLPCQRAQWRAVQAKLHPGVPIYGGSNKAPALTHIVKDKDEFTFEGITIR